MRLVPLARQSETVRKVYEAASVEDLQPGWLSTYFGYLGTAWVTLMLPLAFTSTVLAGGIATTLGHGSSLAAAAALGAACAGSLTGTADCIWRATITDLTDRRFRRHGWSNDALTLRAMRVALIDDRTFLLQLVAAALTAWWLA